VLVLGTCCLAPPVAAGAPAGRSGQDAGAARATVSPEALDLLLAPIALYPDTLLAQVLLCAQNPPRIGELAAWLKQVGSLKGSQLQEAAGKAGFEPSFVALALFPQVVNLMATDPSWTTQVGKAFAADRSAVFASIQRLRVQSQEVGQLKSTPQQTVDTRTTGSGEQVIVIEPANPQVVYVPQYDTQVVYTQPPSSTTVVVQQESNTGAAVAAGAIGFAAGVAIGAAIDNDYYYGPYGWRGGAYMYDDAWDDWYDDREDAREDWYENREDAREDVLDHREDLAGERSERAATQQQQRTDRQQSRQEARPETQAQREQRRTDVQAQGTERTAGQGATTQARSTAASSNESRGSRSRSGTTVDRSGSGGDAFSGYSSGRSERAASARGQRSRSSSGGRSRRR
jgi:hypothetical protein